MPVLAQSSWAELKGVLLMQGFAGLSLFSVFLLFAASLVRFVPLPVISALILSYVCNMSHWSAIPKVLKRAHAAVLAWLAISILTVATDIAIAIAVGMLFSIFLYIRRPREPVLRRHFDQGASPDT